MNTPPFQAPISHRLPCCGFYWYPYLKRRFPVFWDTNTKMVTCHHCGTPWEAINILHPEIFQEWKNKVARLQDEIQRLELKLKTLENALQEYDCSKEKSYPIDPFQA